MNFVCSSSLGGPDVFEDFFEKHQNIYHPAKYYIFQKDCESLEYYVVSGKEVTITYCKMCRSQIKFFTRKQICVTYGKFISTKTNDDYYLRSVQSVGQILDDILSTDAGFCSEYEIAECIMMDGKYEISKYKTQSGYVFEKVYISRNIFKKYVIHLMIMDKKIPEGMKTKDIFSQIISFL